MQESIRKLVELGVFPTEVETLKNPKGVEYINHIEFLISKIERPITDEEAVVLCSILGTEAWDDCFGLTQTLLQVIESAQNWPIRKIFENNKNFWVNILKSRARFMM